MDDRRVIWLLVLGGLAFVVGVVALLIAIDAKNSTTSDEDLAKSVRGEIEQAVPQLKTALSTQSRAITTARAQLRRAERTQKRLAGGQAIDRGDLNKLSTQLKATNGQISRLSNDVKGLTNNVNALNNQQDRTRDTIATLTRRVNRLQVQVQEKKNK